uniref:Putative secreted protein n=1 Tax=Anopheles darlingi TaxID=43151 RepID=A0A2M4DCQ0_ANODA
MKSVTVLPVWLCWRGHCWSRRNRCSTGVSTRSVSRMGSSWRHSALSSISIPSPNHSRLRSTTRNRWCALP